MKIPKLPVIVSAFLSMFLFFPASQVFANGDSSCDDECVIELRQMIEAQQRQLQQQAELLSALQQRVDSIDVAPAISGDAKNQPGVVKSGGDTVKLSVSGQVNRGILYADDGGQSDVFHVDNDNSSTRIRLIGEAKPSENLTIGTNIEVQFESNSTAAVNQNSKRNVGPNNFTERKLELYIDSPLIGRVTVGQGDTASNSTSEVDLSGTSVVGYSGVADLAGGILFRDNAGNLTATNVGSVFSNLDGLSRDDRIRYDTPSMGGVKLSTSFVADDRWDAALRYGGDFGPVKAAAAIAYSDPNSSAIDNRVNGSLSLLHNSGLNFTAAAGRDDSNDNRDPEFWYVKLGYKNQFNSWGPTALAVDYYNGEDIAQAGDESTVYGAFAVQNLSDYGTEFYLGMRNYELERQGAELDDVFAVLGGARVKF